MATVKHHDTHLKSSRSIRPYFKNLWNFVKDYDYKLIGKPYGCQPMLEVWSEDKGLSEYHDLIENYNRPGIEHEEIPFIDYADYTLGNALGIAQGIAIVHPEKKIFVFISDAQMNMGVVQEAITSIGAMNLRNILLCVDYNYYGSRGKLKIIPEIEYTGWKTSIIPVINGTQMLGDIDNYLPNMWIYHQPFLEV